MKNGVKRVPWVHGKTQVKTSLLSKLRPIEKFIWKNFFDFLWGFQKSAYYPCKTSEKKPPDILIVENRKFLEKFQINFVLKIIIFQITSLEKKNIER